MQPIRNFVKTCSQLSSRVIEKDPVARSQSLKDAGMERGRQIIENSRHVASSRVLKTGTDRFVVIRTVRNTLQTAREISFASRQIHNYVFHRYRLRLGLIGFILGGALGGYIGIEGKKNDNSLHSDKSAIGLFQGALTVGIPLSGIGACMLAFPEVGIPFGALYIYSMHATIKDEEEGRRPRLED